MNPPHPGICPLQGWLVGDIKEAEGQTNCFVSITPVSKRTKKAGNHHHITPYRINNCCHSKMPLFFRKPKLNRKQSQSPLPRNNGPTFEFSYLVEFFIRVELIDHWRHLGSQAKRAVPWPPPAEAHPPYPQPHVSSNSDHSCKQPIALRSQSHTARVRGEHTPVTGT